MIGQKLRYYRDKTFKARSLAALPLPAPLVGVLPDAPRVAVKAKDTEDEARGGTIEPAEASNPRYATPESVRAAIDEIPVPRGHPSQEDMARMAEALAQITHYADPEALAAFAHAA